MIWVLFKKYWFFLLIYLLFQSLLYINKINLNNPITYFNFILYFITFLLIRDSLFRTKFNKHISNLFYLFYGYLSIVMSLSVLTRNIEKYSIVFYVYFDLIIKFIILLITIYLLLYSFKLHQNKENKRVVWTIIISAFIIFANYYKAKFWVKPTE